MTSVLQNLPSILCGTDENVRGDITAESVDEIMGKAII